jgi:aryl-alcohol dehydrogenase-like predicted oxidoreductase
VTFGREIDDATSQTILDHAMDLGITLLDTAAVYGDGASEKILGSWMRDRATRDRVVLATKVSGRLSRDRIIQSAEASLKRLATDRIDLLQAHDWDGETRLEETLEAFHTLVERGRVAAWGCSNWSADQLAAAQAVGDRNGWTALASVQPIYNLVDRQIEERLLDLCATKRIGVISYSPLGAGFLTGKYRRDGVVPQGTRFDVKPAHRDIYFTEHGFRIAELLRAAAEKARRTMPELALAWVFRQPAITSVLVGARTPRHLDQAFEAMKMAQEPALGSLLDDVLDHVAR